MEAPALSQLIGRVAGRAIARREKPNDLSPLRGLQVRELVADQAPKVGGGFGNGPRIDAPAARAGR